MNKKDLLYDERFGKIPKDIYDRIPYIFSMLKMNKEKDFDSLFDYVDKIKSVKKKELNFIIYKEPQATARPRVTRFSVFVPHSKDNIVYFKKLLEEMKITEQIITPTTFICKLYRAIPSNMSKVEKVLAELGFIRPVSRPDWDNLGKTYSDMIQGGLLLDDSLIVDSVVRKYFSFKPRVEITLTYDETFNSRYLEKIITSWKQYLDSKK